MNKFMFAIVLLMAQFVSQLWTQQAFAHARLVTPSPRNLNAGNKVAPCGSTAKPSMATHTFTAKSTISVQITEVIDHPGKYLFYLSSANDANFLPYTFPIVPDIQGGQLPHTYNVNLVLPDITCENCTLQMIQSMEENPANPSFYYSCADIKIVSAATPLPVGSFGASGSAEPTAEWPKMGCGRVSDQANDHTGNFTKSNGSDGNAPNRILSFSALVLFFLFSLPLLIALILRAFRARSLLAT